MKYLGTATFLLLLNCLQLNAALRVALMDFSTDDNSYRSAQVAADFTGILQANLAGETNIEWVERAQLEKARQELELSLMSTMGGNAAISRGKWAKADWLVTGQFSLDDQNRRTLALEITDLQHADVLARQTLIFSNAAVAPFQTDSNQVNVASVGLSQLLIKALARQQATEDMVLVAPLFLAEVTRNGFSRGGGVLEQGFENALERSASTNGHIRLVRFPKAYRSAGESEMVLDGLVEADQNAWQHAADLYVWGTYAVTNQMNRGQPPERRLEITLNLWDGSARPMIFKVVIPCDFPSGNFSAEQAEAALNRLAGEVMAHAHKGAVSSDTAAIRREIAESLVKSYDQMTLSFHHREELGLNDPEKFLQAVHLLETACFFDPDNADARVLYITCRWGWWMDFRFKVKNEFWSKWRRSEAWGKYVNRFGLKPVTEELPFPYQQDGGIAAMYVRSLQDVAEMFPGWHSAEEMALEDEWKKQGVHTWLTEAELHGFPKEMPHDVAMKWKMDVQTEHWKRVKNAADFIKEGWTMEGKMPPSILSTLFREILNANQPAPERLALLEKTWPKCVESAQKFGKQWIVGAGQLADDQEQLLIELGVQAGKPERGSELLAMLTQKPNQSSLPVHSSYIQTGTNLATAPNPSQMIPTPAWAHDILTFYSMFRLFPPDTLPLEVKPDLQEIRFPKQFEVQTVDQLDFLGDQLLILAMDERSAPSSDRAPDVSADLLAKRKRLWVLKPGAEQPTLFEPDRFSQSINGFLIQAHQLWVAGKNIGCLDLDKGAFRKFGLTDGLDQSESDALTRAGDRLFSADGDFKVSVFDAAQDRWSKLFLPPARLSSGTGSPTLLAGNQRWLGYVAGSVLIHDFAQNSWTNLAGLDAVQHILADESGFWLGGYGGLHFYDPATQSLKSWTAPGSVNGLFTSMMGTSFAGNSEMHRQDLERMDGQIQSLMAKLQSERKKHHVVNREPNPLHLDWRIPGEVTTLTRDGDFLWLGVGNYFGNHLLLLHLPSGSLVAGCTMPVRDKISSLAISKSAVWAGTAYGDHQLFRIPKDVFTSVPQSRWVSLTITPEERTRLISGMSIRDQAMHAFYAGDDAQVAALLGNLDPTKAKLDEVFVLAFSYDVLGLDRPDLARSWFRNIISRYPDSPWAKIGQAALAENEQNHKTKAQQEQLLAKYDRNKNGLIDPDEKRVMESNPDYQREQTVQDNDQLKVQVKAIMQKFDRNGDGKLDRGELDNLKAQVPTFSQAPPEMLSGRKILVAPLLGKNFPSVPTILKKYDANQDGSLNVGELDTLAQAVQQAK